MQNFTYFQNVYNLAQLKQMFRQLAKKHHPDVGGSNEAMKAINEEYEKLFKILESGMTYEQKQKNLHDLDDGFREAVMQIINLNGLSVELIGAWIWVQGDTKTHKEALKAADFKFHAKKLMWYWRKSNDGFRRYKKHIPIQAIRRKYGSQKIYDDNAGYFEEREPAKAS